MKRHLIVTTIVLVAVVILGITLRAPWWQILIAAVIIDVASDIAYILRAMRRTPDNECPEDE
jgi:hypothetical protein